MTEVDGREFYPRLKRGPNVEELIFLPNNTLQLVLHFQLTPQISRGEHIPSSGLPEYRGLEIRVKHQVFLLFSKGSRLAIGRD